MLILQYGQTNTHNNTIILEVIYHMELGDCAFVKRSDGSWTFAYFQGIYWRGENDKGPFGKEAVATFTVDESTMKERHIPERRWLSSIRLWNTSKYRGAINMLDLDGTSSDHTRELADRKIVLV